MHTVYFLIVGSFLHKCYLDVILDNNMITAASTEELEKESVTFLDISGDFQFTDTNENDEMVDKLLNMIATEGDVNHVSKDKLHGDNSDIEINTGDVETVESERTGIVPTSTEINTKINEVTTLVEEDQISIKLASTKLASAKLTSTTRFSASTEELEKESVAFLDINGDLKFTDTNENDEMVDKLLNMIATEADVNHMSKDKLHGDNADIEINTDDVETEESEGTRTVPTGIEIHTEINKISTLVEEEQLSIKVSKIDNRGNRFNTMHLDNKEQESEKPTTNYKSPFSVPLLDILEDTNDKFETSTIYRQEQSKEYIKNLESDLENPVLSKKDYLTATGNIEKVLTISTTNEPQLSYTRAYDKITEKKSEIYIENYKETTSRSISSTKYINGRKSLHPDYVTAVYYISMPTIEITSKNYKAILSTKPSNRNKIDGRISPDYSIETRTEKVSGNMTTKCRKKFGVITDDTAVTRTELWKVSTESSDTTTIVTKGFNNVESAGERRTTTAARGTTNITITRGDIKNIAYYLRDHKFNEYDRRYETNPEKAPRRYFQEFPRPPLRSLHWEVRKFCETSFVECLNYLRKRIKYTALKRVDDTVVVIHEQRWTMANNSQQIQQIDEECRKMKQIDDKIADPFEGPLERFQWRATASYYMCWYTMRQIRALEHLFERCDNFANCLDTNFGPDNLDWRANDPDSYSCAMYSFCPDPCCSQRHLSRPEDCWNSPDNPCFDNNPEGSRECAVNRSRNTDFRDIVLNRWNVTCRCPKAGTEWNSLYGMCVDVDECTAGTHNCDQKLQACVNLEGSFRCACKWGHIWEEKTKTCTPSQALHLIKLGRRKDVGDEKNATESLLERITKYLMGSNKSSVLEPNSVIFVFSTLCVFVCLY